MNITQIPTELKNNIFEYLESKDLIILSKSSSAVFRAVRFNFQNPWANNLWRHFNPDPELKLDKARLLKLSPILKKISNQIINSRKRLNPSLSEKQREMYPLTQKIHYFLYHFLYPFVENPQPLTLLRTPESLITENREVIKQLTSMDSRNTGRNHSDPLNAQIKDLTKLCLVTGPIDLAIQIIKSQSFKNRSSRNILRLLFNVRSLRGDEKEIAQIEQAINQARPDFAQEMDYLKSKEVPNGYTTPPPPRN